MSYFLTGFLSAMIGGSFAALAMAALQINRMENRDKPSSGSGSNVYRFPRGR